MKSVLLNTTVIGTSVKMPRHPKLIVGEPGKYLHGDILDANAVTKEIEDAVSQANMQNDAVQQMLQQIRQELEDIVNAKIAEIVGSAPEALDTLKEIADAINNNPAFAEEINSMIGQIGEKNDDQDAAINNMQVTINEINGSTWNEVVA